MGNRGGCFGKEMAQRSSGRQNEVRNPRFCPYSAPCTLTWIYPENGAVLDLPTPIPEPLASVTEIRDGRVQLIGTGPVGPKPRIGRRHGSGVTHEKDIFRNQLEIVHMILLHYSSPLRR